MQQLTYSGWILDTQDKSFTLTLFAHDSTFSTIDAQLAARAKSGADDKLDADHPVVDLFRREFPDALELMGEEALVRYWRENPKDGLITVEVRSTLSSLSRRVRHTH